MSDKNQRLSIYYQDNLLSLSLCTSTPNWEYISATESYVYLLITLIQVILIYVKTSYFIHFIFVYKYNYILGSFMVFFDSIIFIGKGLLQTDSEGNWGSRLKEDLATQINCVNCLHSE